MTLNNTVNPVVLCSGQSVGSTALSFGGTLANPKIQPLENIEAIETNITISAGTMPVGTTIKTYLYKGTTQIAPVISSTLTSCTSTAKILSTTQTHANIGQADGYMTIVTLVAMSGTPYTADIVVCPQDQVTDNYISFQGAAADVTFSGIAAGVKSPASAATITINVVDSAGAAITVPQAFTCWLSTDATGATPRIQGAQSTFAIGAKGSIPFTYAQGAVAAVAPNAVAVEVVTDTAGVANLTVIETATATLYLNVKLSNKKIARQAITFA